MNEEKKAQPRQIKCSLDWKMDNIKNPTTTIITTTVIYKPITKEEYRIGGSLYTK